jgi:hypothetical protein
VAAGDTPGDSAPSAAAAAPPPELPRGGRDLLPAHRLVAYYGAPQDDALGALGIGSLDQAARRLEDQAEPYVSERRPVLPTFELLATIADAEPGEDGLYRTRQDESVIRRYLAAAREADALLLLDIQPGQADFMTEVRALEEFLAEPDVGLALDPEWHMGPGEVPGQAIGSVDAATVNRVARYLADLVEREDLPEKLLLVHQFTEDMIANRDALEAPSGVALTLNVDGFGTAADKQAKYRDLVERRPDHHIGFKLFYEEDTGLMSPDDVLDLRPAPDVVIYE